MVENKHSINNILSFGAKSVNPKILENLLVGRKKTVKYLYESVETIVKHKQNQFILIVGQRGMGKTHLIRVLFHRIQPFINKNKLEVAYFSEEEYGVANYFDFLLRIINALMKWNEKDKEILQNKISELQEVPVGNREYFTETIIEEYIAKKPLLVLAENFADILEAIKPAEQAKLRAWLYKNNKVSIIATSQAISKDFEREDRPFYGFFNVYYLKKLTYEDTVAFLILLAKADKREDVIDFINHKGKGQIKALHSLVKGNHRLLVTFYQFLKTDTLADLSVNFIKTINDLKPYYETYIRNLPPQQQKVLRYIALNRKPIQGVEISKNCFIDQKSLTKQLSELIKKRLVEAITNPNDKRNKLYDIDEPLLRISIEVGEHKEGITAIFIDFLAIYYNENELMNKKEHFTILLKECCEGQEEIKLNYEIQAIDKALKLRKTEYASLEEKDIQKAIKQFLVNNKEKDLFDFLKKERLIKTKEEYYVYLANYYYFLYNLEKAIMLYKKATEINPKYADAFNNWGTAIYSLARIKSDEKLFLESFEKYKIATEINPKDATAFNNWGNAISDLAKIKPDEKLYLESFEKYKKATKINPKYADAYYNWGTAISDLAKIKTDEKLYLESFEKYKIATEINPKDATAFNNWGIAIYDLAEIKSDEKLYLESFEKYKIATEINPKYAVAYYNWGIAIYDLAKIKTDEKLYLESIEKYKIATDLNPKYATAFNNWALGLLSLAILKDDFSSFEEIIQKTTTAISLKPQVELHYKVLLFAVEIVSDRMVIKIEAGKIINVIQNLSKANFHNLINKWIVLSLKISKSLNKIQLEILSKISKKHKMQNPELSITENYIEIYKRYVLENDKKAIYDLPKEQRLFFEEQILQNK